MQMSDLDRALERTLAMRFNLGMFDAASAHHNAYLDIGAGVLNSAKARADRGC